MNNLENQRHLYRSPYYVVKLRSLLAMVCLAFIVIFFRLFHLQVIEFDSFRERSLNSRKQVVTIPSFRGGIFVDDGATPIVKNSPSFSLYLVPENFIKKTPKEQLTNGIESLAEEFSIETNRLRGVLKKGRANPYRSYLIKQEVPREKIYKLAENLEQFPGIIYGGDYLRYYPYGDKYSHITGYIRPISVREYRDKKDLGYNLSSLIGKQGIEGYYDLELRGREGYKVQLIDIKNRIKEEYQVEEGEAIPGKDIVLTIDSRVQDIVYRTLHGYTGGAIVTKVSTGEVLGLYSYPSYDPNIFIGNFDREAFEALRNNPDRPFFNRVIQGVYPPSSVFKLVLTLAAMETPTVDLESFRAVCYGGLKIGPTFFGCEGVHLQENYFQAIAESCNVFFYQLGIKLGPRVIGRFATSYFGFGKKTGIDLLYERPGLVPTQRWKIENRGVFWWDGDTANFSIGQGFIQSTIAQINVLTAAIAGDGIAYKPHLMKRMISKEFSRSDDGKDLFYEKKPELLVELPFAKDDIKRLQRAMRAVVDWGTARRMNSSKLLVAGKTGTSQVAKGQQPHGWFTAYAPYDGPVEDRIAVTVFLEHGGHGGEMAAPFATAILEGIFLGVDPLFAVKRRLQSWKSKNARYENWLDIKKEKKLDESFFSVEGQEEAVEEVLEQ